MANIHKANVAGQFYPGQDKVLVAMINKFLAEADIDIDQQPKAIIAPHAGYVYSGPIAASAYATLLKFKNNIKKVVLLCPAHRMYFTGIAATEMDYFETPLGNIPVKYNMNQVLSIPEVRINEFAYNMEHSLEVQLPFLQIVLKDFNLIPLVIGDASSAIVSKVLEFLWGDKETLIVISSDLCHYHDYDTAKNMDKLTSEAIINL